MSIFFNNQRKRNNECVVNDREFALKNSSTLNKCLILNIFFFILRNDYFIKLIDPYEFMVNETFNVHTLKVKYAFK